MVEEVMLTTKDNPYDPFTQFDQWYLFDELKGYHSCGYLARIANTSSDLSDEDNNLLIDIAIEDIIAMQPDIYTRALRKI